MPRKGQSLLVCSSIAWACGCGSRTGLAPAEVVGTEGGAASDAAVGAPDANMPDSSTLDSSAAVDSGPCVEPTPTCSPAQGQVVIASAPAGVLVGESLAVDRTSVYWSWEFIGDPTTSSTYGLVKASKCGGPVTTLASGAGYVGGVAVDSCNVYWLGISYDASAGTSLLSTPVGGGTTVTLAAAPGASSMTIDATSAYWTASTNNGEGIVMRVPLTGGTPITLAAMPDPQGIGGIAVEGGTVYWSLPSNGYYYGNPGEILTVPIDGGMPMVFGGQAANEVVVNSSTVFWTTVNTTWVPGGYFNTVVGVDAEPMGGGATVTLLSAVGSQQGPGAPATMFTTLGAMVADDANVYVARTMAPPMASVGSPDLVRLPLDGGMPITLTSGEFVQALAVDTTSLYWASESADGGAVVSLTPK